MYTKFGLSFVLATTLIAGAAQAEVQQVKLGQEIFGQKYDDRRFVRFLACHPHEESITILLRRPGAWGSYELAFRVRAGDRFVNIDIKRGEYVILFKSLNENCVATFEVME